MVVPTPIFARTAVVSSPRRSRFGPISTAFHGRPQVAEASRLGHSFGRRLGSKEMLRPAARMAFIACSTSASQPGDSAGVMPVTSLSGMKRMAELAAGARYPAKLMRALDRAKSNAEAVERVGIHYAAEQCAGLLNEGVDGIHFYTLNKSHATREIYHSLGLAADA